MVYIDFAEIWQIRSSLRFSLFKIILLKERLPIYWMNGVVRYYGPEKLEDFPDSYSITSDRK